MVIKHRYTGSVIYKDDSKTFKETVKNATLAKVDLSGSDLSGSDLSGSDLSFSYQSESDLSGSDLSFSDLSFSDLRGSDLSGSDLSGSDLRYCDLSGSDLSGSDLSESNLNGSNLSGSYGLIYVQMSFTGFGQRNRLITLADVNRDDKPIFFCGCFKGTNEELISYIESGEGAYKESRHFARKTLLEAIKFSNNKNK